MYDIVGHIFLDDLSFYVWLVYHCQVLFWQIDILYRFFACIAMIICRNILLIMSSTCSSICSTTAELIPRYLHLWYSTSPISIPGIFLYSKLEILYEYSLSNNDYCLVITNVYHISKIHLYDWLFPFKIIRKLFKTIKHSWCILYFTTELKKLVDTHSISWYTNVPFSSSCNWNWNYFECYVACVSFHCLLLINIWKCTVMDYSIASFKLSNAAWLSTVYSSLSYWSSYSSCRVAPPYALQSFRWSPRRNIFVLQGNFIFCIAALHSSS